MGATCGVIGEQAEAQKWYRSATTEWEKMMAKGLYPPDEHRLRMREAALPENSIRRAPQTVRFPATKK